MAGGRGGEVSEVCKISSTTARSRAPWTGRRRFIEEFRGERLELIRQGVFARGRRGFRGRRGGCGRGGGGSDRGEGHGA